MDRLRTIFRKSTIGGSFKHASKRQSVLHSKRCSWWNRFAACAVKDRRLRRGSGERGSALLGRTFGPAATRVVRSFFHPSSLSLGPFPSCLPSTSLGAGRAFCLRREDRELCAADRQVAVFLDQAAVFLGDLAWLAGQRVEADFIDGAADLRQ